MHAHDHHGSSKRPLPIVRWVLLTLVAAAAVFGFSRIRVASHEAATPAGLDVPLPAGALVFPGLEGVPQAGAADPRVLMVVVSDFECPFCARGEANAREVMGSHGGLVRLAFVNFPLQFHARARPAAMAAVAAARQGRFWSYAASLFDAQDRLKDEDLEARARDLKLDLDRFRQDRLAANERIERDKVLAGLAAVNGTPAFLVNGRRIEGASSWEKLARAVDEEAVKVQTDLAAGLPLVESLRRRIAENGGAKLAEALLPPPVPTAPDVPPPGM